MQLKFLVSHRSNYLQSKVKYFKYVKLEKYGEITSKYR